MIDDEELTGSLDRFKSQPEPTECELYVGIRINRSCALRRLTLREEVGLGQFQMDVEPSRNSGSVYDVPVQTACELAAKTRHGLTKCVEPVARGAEKAARALTRPRRRLGRG